MRNLLSAALCGVIILAPEAVHAGTLTLAFSGLTPKQGHLAVQVCTPDEYVRYVCARRQMPKVDTAQLTVTFDNVPAGRYAVMSYQDLNDDGRIGLGMNGVPNEPWGYSGHPEFLMGQPSFDSVAVDVPAAGASIAIHMQSGTGQ